MRVVNFNKLISRSVKNLFIATYAALINGFPARKLKVIGVTGTDGKTTTANLIYWILKSSGKKVGLISTVSAKIGDKEYDTGFHVTTPDPLPLQKFLGQMVRMDCEYVVIETTSHGLNQNRLAGINFEVGVLTNITHEHLDYHKTMKNYIAAKSKLFDNSKLAILNRDDANFGAIDKVIDSRVRRVLYDKDVLVGEVRKAVLAKFFEPYNFMNATAAFLVVRKLGIKDETIIEAIKTFPGVEGRMEEIVNKRGLRIIVDFAHTPNALRNVLETLKQQKPKKSKLVAVLGCAGERDTEKRPIMGKIASELADYSIFTAEDPRSESVNEIINEMIDGVPTVKRRNVSVITDRRKAISHAINKLARKGDVIVICGKGHEKSMNFGGIEYEWSDKKTVEFALA
jgi:UDP-N-acetylmuramoyl-L-alanyl-D-glutamate--2,6-diaminopimelate ligase